MDRTIMERYGLATIITTKYYTKYYKNHTTTILVFIDVDIDIDLMSVYVTIIASYAYIAMRQ